MTPVLSLSLKSVDRNISQMIQLTGQAGCCWQPELCRGTPSEVLSALVAQGVSQVAFSSLAAAADWADSQVFRDKITNSLLTALPCSAEFAEQVVQLHEQMPLTAAIDHFWHAELLSHAARRRGAVLPIVLEVDTGCRHVGVRPGYDALRLAEAAAALPGLRVAGILTDDRHVHSGPDPDLSAAETYGVLKHVSDLMCRAGLSCDLVAAGRTGSIVTASDHPAVTHVLAGNVIYDTAELAGNDERGIPSPALLVSTSVVSRPTLHRAVLRSCPALKTCSAPDTGTLPVAAREPNPSEKLINVATTGPDSPAGSVSGHAIRKKNAELPLIVMSIGGATVVSADSEYVVLSLTHESLELQIGDSVDIGIRDAHWPLVLTSDIRMIT